MRRYSVTDRPRPKHFFRPGYCVISALRPSVPATNPKTSESRTAAVLICDPSPYRFDTVPERRTRGRVYGARRGTQGSGYQDTETVPTPPSSLPPAGVIRNVYFDNEYTPAGPKSTAAGVEMFETRPVIFVSRKCIQVYAFPDGGIGRFV